MQRLFLPLALIVMVLVGTWLIWPQPQPRAPLGPEPGSPRETLPAPAPAESPAPASGGGEAANARLAAAKATQLIVHCVSRADERPLAGVEVRASGYAQQVTGSDGRAVFEVNAGTAFAVSADDQAHNISFETVEVPALAEGEVRELVFRAPLAK